MALYKALKKLEKEIDQPRLAVVQNFRAKTEQKAADQPPADENKALYDFLLELTPFPICISTFADGRLLAVNQGWSQLTGLTPEAAVGHTAEELGFYNQPGGRRKILEGLERHGEIKHFNSCVRLKGHKAIHYAMWAQKIRYNGQDCLLTMISCATSELEVREALHQNEIPFRNLLKHLSTQLV